MPNRISGIRAAGAFCAALATAACPSAAAAQETYPARSVQVIMPFPAGSSTDIMVRALTAGLSTRLKQPFVVNYREGGSGAIGAGAIANATPDGYTVGFAPSLVLSVLPVVQPNVGYRPLAIEPVCQTFSNTMAVAVHRDSPLKSLRDLVEGAKQRPGLITYGHLGVASIPHLAMTELADTLKIELRHVPYRGDPAVVANLLGGHIEVGAIVLGSAAGQDQLRLLAVFANARNPAFPDVPTAKEQGYDVQPASIGGLLVPAGTPAGVKAVLEQACEGAAKDEIYVTAAKRAFQPADYYAGADVFAQRLAKDISDKARLLESIGAARKN